MSWWLRNKLQTRLPKIGVAVVGCSIATLYQRSRDVVIVDDSQTAPDDYVPCGTMSHPQLDNEYDVAVIGGGINGLFVAFEAQRRGLKTVLLEAGDLATGSSGCSPAILSTFLLHINRSLRMRCPEELFEAWEQLKEIRRMSAFLSFGSGDVDGVLRQDVGVVVPCFSTTSLLEVSVACGVWWLMSILSGPCVSSDPSQRSAHRPGGLPKDEINGRIDLALRRWLPLWFLADMGLHGRANSLGFFKTASSVKPVAPVPPLTGPLATLAEGSSTQIEPLATFYLRFLRVDGFLLSHVLAKQITFMGGTVRSHSKVEQVVSEGNGTFILYARNANGKKLQTKANRVVNCCGAWSENLQPIGGGSNISTALLYDPSPSCTDMYALRDDASNRDADGRRFMLQGYQQNVFVRMSESILRPNKNSSSSSSLQVNSLLSLENLSSSGAVSQWPWGVRRNTVPLVGISCVGLDRAPTVGSAPSLGELTGIQQTAKAILQCAAIDVASPNAAVALGTSTVLSASLAPLSQVSRRTFFSDVATNVLSFNGKPLWYNVYGGNYLSSRRNAERIGLHLAEQTVRERPDMMGTVNVTSNLRPMKLPSVRSYISITERVAGGVEHEFAQTLSDMMFRRLGTGYSDPVAASKVAPEIARLMAPLRGWSTVECETEVRRFREMLANSSLA